EMHMGATTGAGLARPWLDLAGGTDGAVSADGRVMGAYVHGLFAADGFRAAFVSALRAGDYAVASHAARVEDTLDALAAHLERHLDMDALDAAFT
ncbi:MAG: cobyric acid synthase CobQ, partial [Rhodospirillales bacterium]